MGIFDLIIDRTITSYSNSTCSIVGNSAFRSCFHLSIASFANCTTIGVQAFYQCSALSTISFPKCTTISSGAFYNCKTLSQVSFPKCVSILGSNTFTYCSSLKSYYFMGTSVVTLANSSAFNSTTITNSTYLGTFGSIYVPTSLVATYKAAANWSYFSARIVGA